ncbi:hypothetical protein RCL1_000697 [Eukaryota sp. TZLM3-RCL]
MKAPEATIRIGPQGLSSSPQTLTLGTTHEGSARPAELPVPQDLSMVPSTVPAVPSAPVESAPVVAVPSASTESEENIPLPIYSPVPPFLEEELSDELLAEFEEPRPSSSLPSTNSEFTSFPREWLSSLTELANQGVDIPSLLRSVDPIQTRAHNAPVDTPHPQRSRTRGSSSVSSRIARLSITPPSTTTSSPMSSDDVSSSAVPSAASFCFDSFLNTQHASCLKQIASLKNTITSLQVSLHQKDLQIQKLNQDVKNLISQGKKLLQQETFHPSRLYQKLNQMYGDKELDILYTNGFSIRVYTIDAFQGLEADIVIISITRTNASGFIQDLKRANVTLSRSKHVTILIGDSRIFDDCLKNLLLCS